MTGVLLLLMGGGAMLTDGAWMGLEPLIEACRPRGKTPPQDLRRTIWAILWRHQNGAKWRAMPSDLGPWARAAQTFIRSRASGCLGATAATRAAEWRTTRDNVPGWHQHPCASEGRR